MSEFLVEMADIIATYLPPIFGLVSIDDMGSGRKKMSQDIIGAFTPTILLLDIFE